MILRYAVLLILPALLAGCAAGDRPARASNLQEEIRTVLKQHPELVLEVIKQNQDQVLGMLQNAARERNRRVWRKRVAQELKKPFHPKLAPGRPYLGPENAPYTAVDYSSFLCGYCARGERTLRRFAAKHPQKVRLLMKHVARGDLAKKIALYFEAVGRQDSDKAWKFSEMVFANQKKVRKEKTALLQKFVKKLGVDQKRLFQDLADPELKARVKADTAEHEAFGFHSTPTFLINGVSVRGALPLAAFEEVLERLQKKAAAHK